jgi:WD40-like Beta Propeller Repeat
MPRRRAALLVLVAVAAFALAAPAAAQGPDAAWRTLTTPHFRIHYPAPAEAWSRRLAARLEALRARVVAEVGYAPPAVVDVIVSDPVARPNGAAFALLGAPRMVLWTSPPGADSPLGLYRDWPELLAVHEETHLAHLLRPSRNPLRRALAALVPMGPIALAAPRWLVEGYATLIEGRLTGAGRPNGDLRAAVLRRKAEAGRLPTYRALDSDRADWLGPSMAYLAGSAFLEWLIDRAGEDALRHLWARMTARDRRSFDDAFAGVFGRPPAELYGRFTAELTARAMTVEADLRPALRDGEVWEELKGGTGAPAVSPDGGRLAVVVRPPKRPAELVVWSTAVDQDEVRRRRERAAALLARDPEDVPAVDSGPPPHRRLATLATAHGAAPTSPRWLPGGDALIFVRFEPDTGGFLHPDLFRWRLQVSAAGSGGRGGAVERLTQGADLRSPDPAPDGSWAAAVRNRDGFSQLVRVDLADGAVTPFTAPSLEVVYDAPRVSPDGRRLAYLRHQGGRWQLVVRELTDAPSDDGAAEVELPVPPAATVASPAWGADGRLYAVLGEGGFLDVFAFAPLPGGGWAPPRRVSRTRGAALDPAPTPDGRALFFLSLEAAGLDLRWLDLGAEGAADADLAAPPIALAPAVRPPPPLAPPPPAAGPLPAERSYGLGRPEPQPLLGFRAAPSARTWEAGVRLGDPVGRFDLLAVGGGGGGLTGGAVAAVWRGSPLAVGIHLFAARERPSEQPTAVPGLGDALDADRRGAELRAEWQRQAPAGGSWLAAGGYLGDLAPAADPAAPRLAQRWVFLSAAQRGELARGRWRLAVDAEASWTAGATGGAGWRRAVGRLDLVAGRDRRDLRLRWRRGVLAGSPHPLDRFQLGGVAADALPTSLLAGRFLSPPLAAGSETGDRVEEQRLAADLADWPAPFVARYRLWSDGGDRPRWLRVAGLEWRRELGPMPLLRLPALAVTVGAARVFDERRGDRTAGWAAIVWRP